MAWFLVPLIIILLLVVPYFAADSRDGADWKPATLKGQARGTRRTLPFSGSPGALVVRRAASTARASLRPMRREKDASAQVPAENGRNVDVGLVPDRVRSH
jgi:hypothetical protein